MSVMFVCNQKNRSEVESCFSRKSNDCDRRQMEEDVNYTRSLKMNLTRSGYLRIRSVKERKRRVRFLRYSHISKRDDRKRKDLPLGTLPRRVLPNSFSKNTADALAS